MVYFIVFLIGVALYVNRRQLSADVIRQQIYVRFGRMRKSGILALIFAVFFVYYTYKQVSIYGPGQFSAFIFGPLFGASFWTIIACSVIGAFTSPLVSLILFLVAAFECGIPSMWGYAYLILAAINFFEWKRK